MYTAFDYAPGVAMSVYLIVLACGITLFLFKAIALFQIGKRRGLRNYALAWFSIGASWAMGDIADQYSFVVRSEKKSLRHWMLWTEIGSYGVYMLSAMAVMFTVFGSMGRLSHMQGSMSDAAVLRMMLPMFIGLGLFLLAQFVVKVFSYIACYRIYRSCSPDSAVVFTVLSVLFPILQNIFLFAVRKRDDGMYPAPPAAPAPVPTVGPDQPTVPMA